MEAKMNPKKWLIVIMHAFVGWLLCFATMGIGMATLLLEQALVMHAIAAPILFILISIFYFNRFSYTTPLQTAGIFTGFIMAMDFFFVALLINRSLEMFSSIIGTWLPFALIFLSTMITGFVIGPKTRNQ